MNPIQLIPPEKLDDLVALKALAYPMLDAYEDKGKQKMKEYMTNALKEGFATANYGYYRNGQLLGGMTTYAFEVNLLGTPTLMGGVGAVAVGLLHKKERVAKALIEFFLQDYYKQNACMVALYAFQLDFYQRMGFGFGNTTHYYEIPTHLFPKGNSKQHVRFYQANDLTALLACYHRYMQAHHGMIRKTAFEWTAKLKANSSLQVVVYEKEGRMEGYIQFHFKFKPEGGYHLHIVESIFETKAAFAELMTFLRTQADQVPFVNVRTQDPHWHFLFQSPLPRVGSKVPLHHYSSREEIGILYRIINLPRLFEVLQQHNFNGVSCQLHIQVIDDFFAPNNTPVVVYFEHGKATVQDSTAPFEVRIQLSVAHFSSLVMGTITFERLYFYGFVDISDENYVDTLHQLFKVEQLPQCITRF